LAVVAEAVLQLQYRICRLPLSQQLEENGASYCLDELKAVASETPTCNPYKVACPTAVLNFVK